MENVWYKTFLNNTLRDWVIALSVILLSMTAIRLLSWLIVKKIKAIAAKTKTTIDDFVISAIQSSGVPLLYIYAVYAGLEFLTFSQQLQRISQVVMMLCTTFFLLRALTSFLRYLFSQALSKQEKSESREKQSRGILLIVQAIVWVCGFLFLVDNLGYDITTIVAGLGIGGIAIALAAQAILGDLFSYLVIFFDKPFEIGDFIIVDDKMGVVEYIGIKTTRLRTLSGEQLICANADLTASRIHNFKRMQERRVVFGFGIIYNTPVNKLKVIPDLVKKIIGSINDTRFDRAHFKSFGDFSLDFEVVFYIATPDYNKYMDIQQTINIRLFEIFEKEKIEFAFPTQTILLNKTPWEETFSN